MTKGQPWLTLKLNPPHALLALLWIILASAIIGGVAFGAGLGVLLMTAPTSCGAR